MGTPELNLNIGTPSSYSEMLTTRAEVLLHVLLLFMSCTFGPRHIHHNVCLEHIQLRVLLMFFGVGTLHPTQSVTAMGSGRSASGVAFSRGPQNFMTPGVYLGRSSEVDYAMYMCRRNRSNFLPLVEY